MYIKKCNFVKVLISVILISLIIPLIACSNSAKEGNGKEITTSVQNTESSNIEQNTDKDLEALETETQQSDLESNDSDVSKLCYNPYIPIKPGVVWTYEIQLYGQDEATKFTKTQERIDSDTFTVTESYPGYTLDVTWKCTGDGIIQNEYAGSNTQNMPEGMEFNTIEFKGVTYPPVDEWIVGKTWGMDYTVSAKGDTESGELSYDGRVIIENKIAANESLEVPAGIYDNTLRVNSVLKLDLVYKIQGVTRDVDIELELSTWYAKDVGMVKQVSGPEDSSSTAVLLSME